MRLLALITLAVLCNLYGLVFDMVAASNIDGVYCNLLAVQSCPISETIDYWLSAVSLLLLLPAACCYLIHWISHGMRLSKYSAFLGLLLVTP